MSSIKIKEYDNTRKINDVVNSFAVAVPGLTGLTCYDGAPTPTEPDKFPCLVKVDGCYYYYTLEEDKAVQGEKVFDENGVYECADQSKFKKYIGFKVPTDGQYGNQMAYELLGLGYTVYYILIKDTAELTGTTDIFKPLYDRSAYNIRYVSTGFLKDDDGKASKKIVDLVTYLNDETKVESGKVNGRGDCIALVDLPETAYIGKTQDTAITNIRQLFIDKSETEKAKFVINKFCDPIAPYIMYDFSRNTDYDTNYSKNRKFPGSFHRLACAAKARKSYAEWYAVSGYNRGICDFNIKGIGCPFGEAAIQALQPRFAKDNSYASGIKCAVNLIVKVRDNYYLWGNRTGEELTFETTEKIGLKASHFLNIRELCTTIKKVVYDTCRYYMFDPNSDILWNNFCNGISSTLDKMKADQGIKDYMFIKVDDERKGLLNAKIRIVPIEAVEDFEISLFLEDSLEGANITENDVNAE